jgi:uncharacterized protein YeaO (DUF488 family)
VEYRPLTRALPIAIAVFHKPHLELGVAMRFDREASLFYHRVIMVRLQLKRIYDAPAESDGARILVDRLWPRGIAKNKARIDLWLKDVAPSHELRKKFHGHPEAWDEFLSAYKRELASDTAQLALAELEGLMRKGPVTLLYAARDDAHNNAAALKTWLEKRVR